MEVLPYKDNELGKKKQVALMFDSISRNYDLLNHMLSLGIDIRWRKRAIRLLKQYNPQYILDLATGTGDFAIQAASLKPRKITGIDISEGMLDIGREKISRSRLDNQIELLYGDSENLPFENNKFDAVIVAFGVRNFENLKKGLEEMERVLDKGGVGLILEFSKPAKFPFKQIYYLYFNYILPFIGKIVSKDHSAYQYLPESVKAFPDGDGFLNILRQTGFKNTRCYPQTFGISTIYIGEKV